MFPLCESCRKQVSWNVSHPLAQIIISFLSAPMTLHRHTHSYDATLAWNEHWRQRSGWAGSVCVYDFLLTVSGYVISDCKLPALVYCHCGGVTYSYVTRICFVCHDSVSSTNHMSSDLYFLFGPLPSVLRNQIQIWFLLTWRLCERSDQNSLGVFFSHWACSRRCHSIIHQLSVSAAADKAKYGG